MQEFLRLMPLYPNYMNLSCLKTAGKVTIFHEHPAGCMFRLFEHSDTRHIVRSIPVDRIANLYFDGFIVHVLLLVFASRSFFEERSDVFCFIITFLSDVRIRNLSAFPVILQGPFGYAESLTYVAAVYPFGRGRRTQLLLQPHYFIRHPFGVGCQLCPRLLFNQ